MKFSGKKTIVAAALCGFLAGNLVSVPAANAGGVLGGLGKMCIRDRRYVRQTVF